jgi:hypothetical protein
MNMTVLSSCFQVQGEWSGEVAELTKHESEKEAKTE